MGLEPISTEFTDFLKLELLRDEEARLAEELAEIEKQMREQLLEAARRDYLVSLAPYYAARAGARPDAAARGQLDKSRALTHQALEVVSARRQQFETALGAPAAAKGSRARRGATPPGAARQNRFDSFEDFKQNQGPGPNQPPG